MFLSKLKLATVVLLACFAIGGTFLTFRAPAADWEGSQPAAGKDAPAAIAAAQEPKLAGPPLGDVVNTKDDMVTAAAFATDSQLLAAGGMDKKVRLWDKLTSKPMQTLEGAKGIVRTVAFSPDSKTLAAGADDSGIYLWDVATGKLQAELQTKLATRKAGSAVFVNGLVFLPGGKLAAVYNYQQNEQDTRFARIVLWDIAKRNGETLFEERGNCYGLAPSPDGKLLAATLQGDSNGFKVWDVDSSKVIWEGEAGPDFMSAVAFARDGTKLAVGGGHTIETGQGWLAEGRLWLFDVKARKLVWNVKEAGNGSYNHLAFTADGKGVLTGSSGPWRKYRIQGRTATKLIGELRRWDSATGKVVWKTEGERGAFNAVTVSADGKTVAGSDAVQFMVFDPETGALREVLAKVQQH